ncbi:putative isoflavone oxidoreductase [Coleophoma cylindrospora]|uniref:Putative isoflavone oxidoreductase n=1 Tax=Coleophoma cylindrospora TaxID=1849047 RepID=A0A3D8S0H1_9HELO|nr:putative isoflavone oxidoreductase [Coleophoma cylindrospora]
MARNLLVLGLGELGTNVINSLIAQQPPNTHLTLLLRESTINTASGTKQAQLDTLRSLNVAFLAGDIATNSPAELTTLFRPFTHIISCLGFASGPGSQLKIAQAVLAAQVPYFLPWQFGLDYDVIGRGSAQELFDEQLDVRALLRAQTLTRWMIVSTGIFMSFLFEPWFGVVVLDGAGDEPVVRALGDWENRVTVTTPEDIGRITAKLVYAVGEEERWDGVVFTAGDTISYARLAEVVEEVKGFEVRRERWSTEKLIDDLEKDPGDVVKKYRVVFAKGRGMSWDLERTYNVQKGIDVVDVKTWAEKNL